MSLPLPKSTDGRLVLGCVILGFLLIMAGLRIQQLDTLLAARPLVSDHVVDNRTEDVRRGPVKKIKTVVTAPDGTKTVTTSTDSGAVEVHKKSESETSHQEIPIQDPASRARTRYVGLGVDPLNYARLPRLRAGVTLWERLDAGVAYDSRFSPVAGAFQLEAAWRF